MGVLNSVAKLAIAASIPLAFVSTSSSASPSSCSPFSFSIALKSPDHSLPSPDTRSGFHHLVFVRNLAASPNIREMEAYPSLIHDFSKGEEALPELLTEFMVDMKCDGCASTVKKTLHTVKGVKNVEVDLSNKVVRVLGSSPVMIITELLEQTGRQCHLIGQGVPEDFSVSAAVAEFKGPNVYGVVRLAQVNMELARVEANFGGLSPGEHGWCINQFGDLTRGALSTGPVYNPANQNQEALGELGTLDADASGEAFFSGAKPKLRVADLIGRSVVVYGTSDKSDPGIAAAVIARSAGVGQNYKSVCTCDGTSIWESTNADFPRSRV